MIFSQLIDQLTRGPSWSAGREGNLVVSSAGNVVDISATGAHTKSRMRERAHGKLSLLLQAQDLNIIGKSTIFVISFIWLFQSHKFKVDILNKRLK